MRNYKSWYWTAVVFQFLTAAIHALSFLNDPQPANDTEKTMIVLMRNYKQDMAGMQVTTWELFLALSSCFSLLYFLGGLTNTWLLRRKADDALLGGILWINLLVFGACFFIMAALTFPPPIALTGLVFLFLGVALAVKKGTTGKFSV